MWQLWPLHRGARGWTCPPKPWSEGWVACKAARAWWRPPTVTAASCNIQTWSCVSVRWLLSDSSKHLLTSSGGFLLIRLCCFLFFLIFSALSCIIDRLIGRGNTQSKETPSFIMSTAFIFVSWWTPFLPHVCAEWNLKEMQRPHSESSCVLLVQKSFLSVLTVFPVTMMAPSFAAAFYSQISKLLMD